MSKRRQKDYLMGVLEPTLMVGLFHGLFPYRLVKKGEFTEVKGELLSFNALYAISFYAVMSMVFLACRPQSKTLQLTNVIWPIVMLLIYWIKTKQALHFFQLVNAFDNKMPYDEAFVKACPKRRRFWFTGGLCLYVYSFVAYIGLYLDLLHDAENHPLWELILCFLSSFLLRIPRILIGFFFVVIADEVVRRFRFVRRNLTLRLRDKYNGGGGGGGGGGVGGGGAEDDQFLLEEMRTDYFNLVKAAEVGSSFFGDALLVVLCQNLYETFHLCYKIIILSESVTFSMVLHYFYDYYMIHSMTTAAENMIKASKSIVKDLRCLPMQYLPNSWLNQIEIMSVQIQAIPLVISASGYFNINRSLLLSILTSIVMYLIVLIQLAPIVKKIEKETAQN